MDNITKILENVVRCKYFEAGVHIKNPMKNTYQNGLGRTTQTLDHVVVVHILIWDKRKSQISEYNDVDVNNCVGKWDWGPDHIWLHTTLERSLNTLWWDLTMSWSRLLARVWSSPLMYVSVLKWFQESDTFP